MADRSEIDKRGGDTLRRPDSVADRRRRPATDGWSRYAEELAELGPIGAVLGDYLGSRLDLLSAADGASLRKLPVRSAPVAPDELRRWMESELKVSVETAYSEFTWEPVAESGLFQWHRAQLHGGEEVVAKVLLPGARSSAEVGLERLIRSERGGAARGGDGIAAALEEFKADLAGRVDLLQEAADLERLKEDLEGEVFAWVPEVYESHTSSRILTRESRSGLAIDCWRGGPGPGRDEGPGPRLGRRLCRLWLHQALYGSVLPLEAWGENILLLADGRIGFLGGPFSRPISDLQSDLRRYLEAIASRRTEDACAWLEGLLADKPVGDLDTLRHRVRHSAPFRDGGWTDGSGNLAPAVLSHWRIAREAGFVPRPVVQEFFRALALVQSAAVDLAGEKDSLLEALLELRIGKLAGELRKLGAVGEWGSVLQDQAILAVDLPRKLDRILDLDAEGEDRARREAEDKSAIEGSGKWLLALALLLVVGAGGAFTLKLVAGEAAVWIERVEALLLLLVGGAVAYLLADR